MLAPYKPSIFVSRQFTRALDLPDASSWKPHTLAVAAPRPPGGGEVEAAHVAVRAGGAGLLKHDGCRSATAIRSHGLDHGES
jgi:hypothetical protein